MSDYGYKTFSYQEHDGIATTVLHNALTGGIITTHIPLPMLPYVGHPDVKTQPQARNR
jgi:hypothetical protein